VGYYNDGTRNYGFLLSQGKFTPFDCPGAIGIVAFGINSVGDIAGYGNFHQTAGRQGYLLKGGVCTVIEYRSEAPSNRTTYMHGINDAGMMVGVWETTRGTRHGILYSKGIFTQLDHGGSGYLWPNAINNAGDIVGQASPWAGRTLDSC